MSLVTMLIGIDGNEANVKNRVGSGQYAYELLQQFAKISSYSSDLLVRLWSREASLKVSSRQARTIKFLIHLKQPPLPDLPKESENFKYKVFGPKKLWTQFALPLHLIFTKKPNVFFSTAHYLPRFCPVPTVVTIHDLSFLHYPEMFRKSDLYQLKIGSKYSINKATHIIAVSQTTKDDIVRNYKVDPTKITVTYEGYDKNRFKPQSKGEVKKIKEVYKIKGDYIIFAG